MVQLLWQDLLRCNPSSEKKQICCKGTAELKVLFLVQGSKSRCEVVNEVADKSGY